METAYGDLKTEPPLQELERYLKWSADMRRESSKEQVPVAKLPGRTS
jgi:hypothetical protein